MQWHRDHRIPVPFSFQVGLDKKELSHSMLPAIYRVCATFVTLLSPQIV